MLVNYHEAAEEELLREIGYLELRTKGLGKRFFAEVRRTEEIISQFPESAERFNRVFASRFFESFDIRSSIQSAVKVYSSSR
jgi:hypothetical protein